MLAVQITLAKLGITKLHLNPSYTGSRSGAELEIEDVVVSSLVSQGETLSGAANARADRRFP